jgi:hypothetical protein
MERVCAFGFWVRSSAQRRCGEVLNLELSGGYRFVWPIRPLAAALGRGTNSRAEWQANFALASAITN